MLTVALAAAGLHENGACHQHLDEKDLILVEIVDSARRKLQWRARRQRAPAARRCKGRCPVRATMRPGDQAAGRHAQSLRPACRACRACAAARAFPSFSNTRLFHIPSPLPDDGRADRTDAPACEAGRRRPRREKPGTDRAPRRSRDCAIRSYPDWHVRRARSSALSPVTPIAYLRARQVLRSVDPSSISSSSTPGMVCERTLSIASSMN